MTGYVAGFAKALGEQLLPFQCLGHLATAAYLFLVLSEMRICDHYSSIDIQGPCAMTARSIYFFVHSLPIGISPIDTNSLALTLWAIYSCFFRD